VPIGPSLGGHEPIGTNRGGVGGDVR